WQRCDQAPPPGERFGPLRRLISKPCKDRPCAMIDAARSFFVSCSMDGRVTVLERAFDLARSGVHSSADDIRVQLRREGFDTRQVVGRTWMRQLNALIKSARGEVPRYPGRQTG